MNIIEIDHVTKDYGHNKGVFDLSFFAKPGEVLGFLGPNGAGKTTTIRQLMGFIRPDQGHLSIMGMDCFLQADRIHRHLGYLPGEIAFMDSMKGTEFIKFVAEMQNIKDLGRARELIDMFDLDPSGQLKRMSKGMKQKIGIVCAFMNPEARLFILDEPTGGLDPLMQEQFVKLILSEKKQGKTILMSSHIFEEIERTCDRAVIIRQGHLVAVEDMEKLRLSSQKVAEITFRDEAMAMDFLKGFLGQDCRRQGAKVITGIGGNLDDFIKQAAKYMVTDLCLRSQSLEELFMYFYGREDRK